MDKWTYGYDRKNDLFNYLHIRNYEEKDFERLIEIQKKAFPPPFPSELWWTKEQLENHIRTFPEGCLCIEVDGVVAGSMTTMMTSFDEKNLSHTWEEKTADGTMKTHDPNGNIMYVIDLCVDPDYRSIGLGRQLTQAMYETVVQLGLKKLIGGARMPRYHKYVQELTPEEYVNLVINSEIHDPVISFLLKSGRSPIEPIKNYIEDEESCNYGLLTEWRNPFIE
ncbi:GNAT family N-acetyltransferase [Halobacillus yeomjeoni]|uniref:GNAT family N-acetyltransferase n=1 Tax=Halobacillus yeomjeoni TaxID=311194 RepID=A0A931HUA4_9BACI|nr:GNAT family N-acetyltransferase [Halobacillus yeomjeoni]MBH0229504.1 GNAT family N-acetyltransferase [Halobacillus yeomjeoni]MCA0983095.1 GNAT family N-acetyltransferase [Halobacillus yeomjeoni]